MTLHPEERLLALLRDTADPWEVAGRARVPFPVLVGMLRDLEERGLVRSRPGRLTLTPAGRKHAPRTVALDSRALAALKRRYLRLVEQRPHATDAYDQGHLTVDSLMGRLREMARFGDLVEGARFAIMGDDDLLSIALALTGVPAQIAVFEIDERLTAFIADLAERHSLPIEVHTHDLRKALPARHRGAYDVFVCDPSETRAGLRMFVGRGLSALAPGPGKVGYFGVTLVESDYEKWRELQAWLTAQPVVLSAVIPEQGFYDNWPTQLEEARAYGHPAFTRAARAPWYRSALWRLETLAGFEPRNPRPLPGDPIADEHYFAIASKERR